MKKNEDGKHVNELVEFDYHLKKCLQNSSEKPIAFSIKYQFDFRIGTNIQENLTHFLHLTVLCISTDSLYEIVLNFKYNLI